jgi:group I intron endonuclease
MKSGIYKIENLITGRVYVGSSIDFKKRWNQHKSCLKNNKHGNSYLQNSWNKHGEKAFKFFIIERCGEELLYEREQYWFNYYKENELVYNVREIVESNKGMKHNEETKKRLSEISKNMSEETRKKIGEASKNSSEETRKKISEANRGKKRSEETKKKLSEASKGHKVSEETRQKLKEINKGHKVSEETKKKISEGHLGVKLSDEHKKKISEGNTGRIFNEETRKKISKTLKLFYKKKRGGRNERRKRI